MDTRSRHIRKWGPALLPAPTAPSEGYAGVRNLVHFGLSAQPYPLSILAHQLRRRFLPNNSLFRGARPIYSTAPPEGSLVFRPFRPGILEPKFLEAKTVQCSAALLGETALASRFAHRDSEEPQEPRRARGNSLFRRPLPGWPRKEPESSSHCLPAEIGPLVTCRTVLPLPAVWRGRDRRPDHPSNMHPSPESRKRKMRD
jgi:hypothetical protein